MDNRLTTIVVFTTGEEILRRCLESVRPVSDEIVAVDTGAKDGARKVAEELGARVYDLEWPNSFADAYNFAMDRVTTGWTLLLDSDEWLLPENYDMLRATLKDETAFACRLKRQDLADEDEYSEMVMLRLWRTHPKMRMQGIIHAQFPHDQVAEVGAGRVVRDTEIRFRHDGFKGGIPKEKLLRNLPYIERELAERPGQFYFEFELASTYTILGDPRGVPMVMELVDRLLGESSRTSLPAYQSGLLSMAMDYTPDEELESERTKAMIELAWKHFSYVPHLMWSLSELEARRGNFQGEFRALVRVEEMAESGNYIRIGIFNPIIFAGGLWVNLLIAAHRIGRMDVVQRNYEKLKAAHPDHPIIKELESGGG